MNRSSQALLTILTAALLGVAVVSGSSLLRLVAAGILMIALVLSVSPVRELALLGWFLLAPYWQEVARTTGLGTALNNGAYLFAGVGIVLWAISLLIVRGRTGRLRISDLIPGLLLIAAALSLALSSLLPTGWTKMDLVRQLYGNVILPVSCFYVAWLGVEKRFAERWLAMLWATSLGVSALTAAERIFGWQLWPYPKWQYVDIGRSVGPLANPAVLGTFLGMVIVSAMAYLIWSRENQSMARLAVVASLAAAPALWFTYARASLLAVLVVVALIAALKSEARATLVLVTVLVVVLLIGAWSTVSSADVVSQRFENVSNGQVRILLAAWSIELAMEKPALGWGYGSFDAAKTFARSSIAEIPTSYASSDTSHNTFLTTAVELGLTGILLMWFAWAPAIWRAGRALVTRACTDWRVFALLGIVMVFWINASFIDMRFFSLPVVLGWTALGALRSVGPARQAEVELVPSAEYAAVQA